MDLSFLSLPVVSVSLASLLRRLVQLRPNSLLPERFLGRHRLHSPGISLFPIPTSRKKTLALAFCFLMGAFTVWFGSSFGSPFLALLPLLVAGLFIEELGEEELGEPKNLQQLPIVLSLVQQLLKHIREGGDLFTALGKASPTLPDGLVKHRVKKTLARIEARLPPEESLRTLRGINPYLDQFVSDCLRAGWKNSPALEIMLELLLERASQRWQRTSQTCTLLDGLFPYLPPARAFIAGSTVMGITLLLQEYQFPLKWVAIAILGAVMLRFMLLHPILRRTLLFPRWG